jgi:hypothetical protein
MRTYFIGREGNRDEKSLDISIVDKGKTVSGLHAELVIINEGNYYLTDCNSKNGTSLFRKGKWERIRQSYVELDDPLRFGKYETTLRRLVVQIGMDNEGEGVEFIRGPGSVGKRENEHYFKFGKKNMGLYGNIGKYNPGRRTAIIVCLMVFLLGVPLLISGNLSIFLTNSEQLKKTVLTKEEIFERSKPAIAFIHSRQKNKGVFRGSGFLVNKNGLVFTNAHVIGKSKKIHVRLADNKKYFLARVIMKDDNSDIALLGIDGNNFSYLKLSQRKKYKVGESLVMIGAPRGLNLTLTDGVVSQIRTYKNTNVIQTNAEMNLGNSGGPMLDKYGYVIGMATFNLRGNEGLGFGIMASELDPILNSNTKK